MAKFILFVILVLVLESSRVAGSSYTDSRKSTTMDNMWTHEVMSVVFSINSIIPEKEYNVTGLRLVPYIKERTQEKGRDKATANLKKFLNADGNKTCNKMLYKQDQRRCVVICNETVVELKFQFPVDKIVDQVAYYNANYWQERMYGICNQEKVKDSIATGTPVVFKTRDDYGSLYNLSQMGLKSVLYSTKNPVIDNIITIQTDKNVTTWIREHSKDDKEFENTLRSYVFENNFHCIRMPDRHVTCIQNCSETVFEKRFVWRKYLKVDVSMYIGADDWYKESESWCDKQNSTTVVESTTEELVGESTTEELVGESTTEELVGDSTTEELVIESTTGELVGDSTTGELVINSTTEEVGEPTTEELVGESTTETAFDELGGSSSEKQEFWLKYSVIISSVVVIFVIILTVPCVLLLIRKPRQRRPRKDNNMEQQEPLNSNAGVDIGYN